MSRRTYRLLAPGLVFAAVGVLVLWLGTSPSVQFRGGLTVAGLYALAGQVVLSLLAIACIDDFGDSRRSAGRRSFAPTITGQRDTSLQRLTFSQALTQFYLQSPLAMGLLAFGLGASLSAIVDGALSDWDFTRRGYHPSELVLGAVLVAGAIFLAVAGGRAGSVSGYMGWCVGFVVAAVVGQEQFIPETDRSPTASTWTKLVVVLCLARVVLWAVMKGIGWLRHRSRPAPTPT